MGDFDGHPFRGNQYTGGTSDPGTMRGSEITKEQGRLEQSVRELTDVFITSGRGHETPKDRQGKTDPLSVTYRKVSDRQEALLREITQRAGPGYYTLPRGVGSKPRVAEWTPAKNVSGGV